MFESYMAERLRRRWVRLRLYRCFDRLPNTEELRQNPDRSRSMKSEITIN
jgi:hypothetical protein